MGQSQAQAGFTGDPLGTEACSPDSSALGPLKGQQQVPTRPETSGPEWVSHSRPGFLPVASFSTPILSRALGLLSLGTEDKLKN